MTADLRYSLNHLLLGGANRYDFERIHDFDPKKLDSWFERWIKRGTKRLKEELENENKT